MLTVQILERVATSGLLEQSVKQLSASLRVLARECGELAELLSPRARSLRTECGEFADF